MDMVLTHTFCYTRFVPETVRVTRESLERGKPRNKAGITSDGTRVIQLVLVFLQASRWVETAV